MDAQQQLFEAAAAQMAQLGPDATFTMDAAAIAAAAQQLEAIQAALAAQAGQAGVSDQVRAHGFHASWQLVWDGMGCH